MKKSLITIELTAILLIISLLVSSPVQAADGDAVLHVIVITDGNVNATFNATAGGDVNYWIEDIEVKSEFEDIWGHIGSLKNHVDDVEGTANMAWGYADYAYGHADSAYQYADNNNESIVYLFSWAGNIEASYLENVTRFDELIEKLRDELDDSKEKVVILEVDLQELKEKIILLESETDDLRNKLSDLNDTVAAQDETINSLKSDMDSIKTTIVSIGTIILLVAIIVCLLFLLNRKYPLGYIVKNGRDLVINGRHKITDYVKRANKADKPQTKTLWHRVKHTRIKRNLEKAPLKLFFSFLQIQK